MAIIPNAQQFHTLSSTVDTTERGSVRANASRESYTMQDIIDTIPPGVSGNNSVYVKSEGTPAENGALLLAGLTAAVAKSTSTNVPGADISVASYSGAIGSFRCEPNNPGDWQFLTAGAPYEAIFDPGDAGGSRNLSFEVTNVGGFPTDFDFDLKEVGTGADVVSISGTPDFPFPSVTKYSPSTLIIGPGEYDIASDFIVNDLVNVTSLTGQPDANITGGNVKIQSGANNSGAPISIVGLNLQSNSLWIESNLSFVNYKNCIALGTNSFSIEPSGSGSITGKFENCIGSFRAFGGGVNVTAAGIFTRCTVAYVSIGAAGAFGGKGSTSGRFEYCGSSTIDYENNAINRAPNSAYGSEGVDVGGFFLNCVGRSQSFASANTGTTNAEFHNCIAENTSLGYRNTNNQGEYYNCKGGNQAFGSNPLSGDTAANAKYYNCVGNTIANSGVNLGSQYINCAATVSWNSYNAGNGGFAYNCYFGSGGAQNPPTGTGKYRNCLDSSLTIINQG